MFLIETLISFILFPQKQNVSILNLHSEVYWPIKLEFVINNYSPKWRWLVVDIHLYPMTLR